MAYVRQWGKLVHYTWAYSNLTLCDQKIDEWPKKAYFSKDLKEGEEMCSCCQEALICGPGPLDNPELLKPRRTTPSRTFRKTPTYTQIRDLMRKKP